MFDGSELYAWFGFFDFFDSPVHKCSTLSGNLSFFYRDVTLFLIFIITAPVLYFLMFIAYYRLKERFGSLKFRSKWPVVNFSKQDGKKKLLVSSTTNPSSCNNTSTITVTCTTTDRKETEVLTSETNCSPPQEK